MKTVSVSLPVLRENLLGKVVKLSLGGRSGAGRTLKEAAAALALELEPHPAAGRVERILGPNGEVWILVAFNHGCEYYMPSGSCCMLNKTYGWEAARQLVLDHIAQYYAAA